MKFKHLLLNIVLILLIVFLVGCGKTEEAQTPTGESTTANTEGQGANPTEGKDNKPDDDPAEDSIKYKAVAAYQEILKSAPAIDLEQDVLNDLSMDYEKNLSMFGEHYDTYAFHDINVDGVPEMIATTVINNKWSVVYVYTYVDGKTVLLIDPIDPMGHGTFNQNGTANGSYQISVCTDCHIHNIWRGTTPMGEAEDIFAYSLEGTTLTQVPCTITDGDGEIFYSDLAQVNDFGEARPVEPSEPKEPTKPVTQMTIKVDHFKVPELYSKCVTEDDMAAYTAVVEAWLNYEPKVKINNPSEQEKLWGMLKECFFLIYSDFDEARGFDYDQEYIYFPYVTNTKEEHDAVIAAFEERVNSFFEGIDESEEGLELARHIYINFNKTLAYNYEIVDHNKHTLQNTSGYTAIMEGSGVCMSFARAYSFLVRQAGALETFCVVGLSGSEAIDNHEWSALKIEDKYYFADPTWDYMRDPSDYMYFCFGLERRNEDGYPTEGMNVCEIGDLKMTDYVQIEIRDLY